MPIPLNITGLRITDAIANQLSGSDLSKYTAATDGKAVEISANGYNSLLNISGAAIYGASESTMQASVSNLNFSGYSMGIGGGSLGTWIPANNYPFAYCLMMNGVSTDVMPAGGIDFCFYSAAGGNASAYTPRFLVATNAASYTGGTTGLRRYFVVKGANQKTTVQSATALGNSAMIAGNATGSNGNSIKADIGRTINTLSSSFNTLVAGFQCIATPNKQW